MPTFYVQNEDVLTKLEIKLADLDKSTDSDIPTTMKSIEEKLKGLEKQTEELEGKEQKLKASCDKQKNVLSDLNFSLDDLNDIPTIMKSINQSLQQID